VLSRQGGNYLPVSEEILLKAFTGYDLATYGPGNVPQAIQQTDWKFGRIGFQPWPYPSATRLIITKMGQTLMEGNSTFLNSLNAEQAANDLVDDSFVRNAINQAGGPELFHFKDMDDPWKREEIIRI